MADPHTALFLSIGTPAPAIDHSCHFLLSSHLHLLAFLLTDLATVCPLRLQTWSVHINAPEYLGLFHTRNQRMAVGGTTVRFLLFDFFTHLPSLLPQWEHVWFLEDPRPSPPLSTPTCS
eukprot:5432941-Amphidinium_carterae.1